MSPSEKTAMSLFTNQRLANDGASTIGKILNAAGAVLCNALEPGPSTPLHPRIAAGDYPLVLRAEGGIYEQYRARFGADWMKGIPQILVPGRQFIEIHIGNYFDNTEGCTLVGTGSVAPNYAASGHWEVEYSEKAYRAVYPVLRDACLAGPATWRVIDEGGR